MRLNTQDKCCCRYNKAPPHPFITLVFCRAQLGCTCSCWNKMCYFRLSPPKGLTLPGVERCSGWHPPTQLQVMGLGLKIGGLKPVACVVRGVGWGGQSALKMFSLCSPGTEVFRIAKTEAGAPASKACASQSRRLLFDVFILLTLLSLCLRNFDGALLSAAFLSFVMLSLYSECCSKDTRYLAI